MTKFTVSELNSIQTRKTRPVLLALLSLVPDEGLEAKLLKLQTLKASANRTVELNKRETASLGKNCQRSLTINLSKNPFLFFYCSEFDFVLRSRTASNDSTTVSQQYVDSTHQIMKQFN
jgi:hypothetical protein